MNTLTKQLCAAALVAWAAGAAQADTLYAVGYSNSSDQIYNANTAVGESVLAGNSHAAGDVFSFTTTFLPTLPTGVADGQVTLYEFDPATGSTVGAAIGTSQHLHATYDASEINSLTFTGSLTRAVAAGDTLEIVLTS